MDLEVVENDIIAKLISVIGENNAEIRSWPTNPADFIPTHPNGTLLVMYNASPYSPPVPNNQKFLTQTRTPQWKISMLTKSLKLEDGHQGAYALLESVRSTLTGYTITGLSDASVMYPISDRLVSESGGTWLYEIVFAFTNPEHE